MNGTANATTMLSEMVGSSSSWGVLEASAVVVTACAGIFLYKRNQSNKDSYVKDQSMVQSLLV